MSSVWAGSRRVTQSAGRSEGSGAHRPLTPKVVRVASASGGGKWSQGFQEATDAVVPVEIGPRPAQPHQDAPAADPHLGGHLDEQGPPGAGLALAQRVVVPPEAEVAS